MIFGEMTLARIDRVMEVCSKGLMEIGLGQRTPTDNATLVKRRDRYTILMVPPLN